MQVIIIGGGVAGLTASIYLAKKGIEVLLIERKHYPFHRVCGEYVSNEAVPFLKSLNAYPEVFSPPQINTFLLSSVNGKYYRTSLDTGGFGISRYSFDHFLFERAKDAGVHIRTGKVVDEVSYSEDQFRLLLNDGQELYGKVVIGAFGKRSSLDKKLDRKFLQKSSPYVGIKYHIRYPVPDNEIALHNFKGGYCGISRVEGEKVNLCYLSERKNLKAAGSIKKMEEDFLMVNPFLKKIWEEAEFLMDNPVVINEINFDSKDPVESHIIMTGDSAGMITPLCGNGMAMAIHSAKIACEEIVTFLSGSIDRYQMEKRYTAKWRREFSLRLTTGRNLQKLFGRNTVSNISIKLLNYSKPISNYIIRQTHGKEF